MFQMVLSCLARLCHVAKWLGSLFSRTLWLVGWWPLVMTKWSRMSPPISDLWLAVIMSKVNSECKTTWPSSQRLSHITTRWRRYIGSRHSHWRFFTRMRFFKKSKHQTIKFVTSAWSRHHEIKGCMQPTSYIYQYQRHAEYCQLSHLQFLESCWATMCTSIVITNKARRLIYLPT